MSKPKLKTLKFTVYVGISYEDNEEYRACVTNARDAVHGRGETFGFGAAIVTKSVLHKDGVK